MIKLLYSTILLVSIAAVYCFDTRRLLNERVRRTTNFADFVSVPLWSKSKTVILLWLFIMYKKRLQKRKLNLFCCFLSRRKNSTVQRCYSVVKKKKHFIYLSYIFFLKQQRQKKKRQLLLNTLTLPMCFFALFQIKILAYYLLTVTTTI